MLLLDFLQPGNQFQGSAVAPAQALEKSIFFSDQLAGKKDFEEPILNGMYDLGADLLSLGKMPLPGGRFSGPSPHYSVLRPCRIFWIFSSSSFLSMGLTRYSFAP